MPGKLTMDPLFCVRQLEEMYKEKNKNLCMALIDLEKVKLSIKIMSQLKVEID